MPKFFINLRSGESVHADPEGYDFETVAEAREEAVLAAREMLARKVKNGEVVDGQQFEIADDSGTILDVVPLRSVIRFE